jgi:leader peptidase (prepilin peptidase) / N-methyltransferase
MNALGVAGLVLVAALAGAAVGSYAGVVADRGWRGSLGGRSRCAACGRDLRWWELVPLVSYASLGGRCRRCMARIPLRVFLVELVGAIVGAGAAVVVLIRVLAVN